MLDRLRKIWPWTQGGFEPLILALLILAMGMLHGCRTAHITTTLERDATTGQPRFSQEYKGPPGSAVDYLEQVFTGSFKYNAETGTYDLEIFSGQDAQGIRSEATPELFGLVDKLIDMKTPPK